MGWNLDEMTGYNKGKRARTRETRENTVWVKKMMKIARNEMELMNKKPKLVWKVEEWRDDDWKPPAVPRREGKDRLVDIGLKGISAATDSRQDGQIRLFEE